MDNIFKYASADANIMAETKPETKLEVLKVEYTVNGGGILVYVKNANYPLKSLPTSDALTAINIIKKLLIEPLKMTKNPFFFLGFMVSNKEKLITAFNEIAWKVMSPHILKEEYRQNITNELDNLIYNSLKNYGISEQNAIKMAQVLSHLIEYDNAYRLRLQDIFCMSTKDRFLKDLNKLCQKSFKRDAEVIAKKTVMLGRMLGWLLFIPRIRKSVTKALNEMDYEKMKFDKGDYYWALQRIDYNVGGYDYQKRMDILKDMGYTPVKSVPIK